MKSSTRCKWPQSCCRKTFAEYKLPTQANPGRVKGRSWLSDIRSQWYLLLLLIKFAPNLHSPQPHSTRLLAVWSANSLLHLPLSLPKLSTGSSLKIHQCYGRMHTCMLYPLHFPKVSLCSCPKYEASERLR